MPTWSRANRRRPSERGAAAVEFALVSVILFTIIFATVQYGLYFWSLQSGAQAAREAARQAAVGALTCAELEAAVLNNARGEKTPTVDAKRTYYTDQTLATPATPPAVGGAVKVVVTFDSIDLGLPFVPFIDNGAIDEQAVARVESITANSVNCS